MMFAKRFMLTLGCVMALVVALGISASAGTVGKITGVVTDEKGEGIPGVSVRIEDTNMGAAASFDGSFVIQNVLPGTYNLVAQSIGYNKMTIQEVKVQADV
ncbi:MAG: carboxypeptidase regulatory-like domain-containing protein, partial [candidate division Zixibacteria bacterium]